MQYSLIVATDSKWGIAKDGNIPWRITEDMKHFKRTTEDHVVIMGKNTYKTLPRREPLKNRTNIVISREELDILKHLYSTDGHDYSEYKSLWGMGFLFVDSPETACKVAEIISPNKIVFVIGGKQVYEWFLEKHLIDEIVATDIRFNANCDLRLDMHKYISDFKLVITTNISVSIPYIENIRVDYFRKKNEDKR